MAFFKVYGRESIVILAVLLVLSAMSLLFFREWKSFGIPEDGKSVGFSEKIAEKPRPVIMALNQRVMQGEKIAVGRLAAAWEENGQDLSKDIHIYDTDGRELKRLLNTKVPGKYELEIVVKSPVTGLESRKKITVLVDGRVET
ncbi:MAG: hypothetical protein J1F22_04775 [Lachnospiraceae bacterium]|nr:hypothetical protein [Lachnospiraceae bacterium]